jgi:hypothetical protein
MSAHMNVTDTYGVTLPANAEAQSAERTKTAAVVPTTGADGEIAKLQLAPMVKEEIKIDYVGAPAFADVASTDPITTSTVTPIKAGMTENNSKPNAGTVEATKYSSLGSAGNGTGVGAGDTDIGTIIIKSVTTTLVESVQRDVSVEEKIVPATNGTPGYRGSAGRKGTFAVRFRGDIPSGISLAVGGAGIYGFTGGVIVVSKLMENQKAGDVNGGEYSGEWAPSAS